MAGLLDAVTRHRLGLFAAAVLILLLWVAWSARGALPVFAVGLALAFILDPPVTRMQRAGIPRWIGVLAGYAVLVALLWLVGAFVIPPLASQTRNFIQDLPRLGAAIADLQQGVEGWYASLPLPSTLRDFTDDAIRRGQQDVGELLRAIAGPTLATLVQALTFVLGLVVVPIWLFFVLKDRERLPGAVAAALPPAWREDALNVLSLLARVGGRWVRGELLLGLAVFAATAIGLTILTVIGFSQFGQFTLVLALIAGVLEWFPVIGPVIAAIPAALVGLSISPAAAVAAIVMATAIQQLENNLLVPKVMGDAVELHPAVLIVALVAGGTLFGIGGAILAPAVVAAGRDLYRYTFRRLAGMSASDSLVAGLGARTPTVAAPAPAADSAGEGGGSPGPAGSPP
jgi:predicted PurR-regulated permease PerM